MSRCGCPPGSLSSCTNRDDVNVTESNQLLVVSRTLNFPNPPESMNVAVQASWPRTVSRPMNRISPDPTWTLPNETSYDRRSPSANDGRRGLDDTAVRVSLDAQRRLSFCSACAPAMCDPTTIAASAATIRRLVDRTLHLWLAYSAC